MVQEIQVESWITVRINPGQDKSEWQGAFKKHSGQQWIKQHQYPTAHVQTFEKRRDDRAMQCVVMLHRGNLNILKRRCENL